MDSSMDNDEWLAILGPYSSDEPKSDLSEREQREKRLWDLEQKMLETDPKHRRTKKTTEKEVITTDADEKSKSADVHPKATEEPHESKTNEEEDMLEMDPKKRKSEEVSTTNKEEEKRKSPDVPDNQEVEDNFTMGKISRPLKSVDVFAGVGGFALGLSGFVEPTAFIEWNPASQKILRHRQAQGELPPNAAIYGDVIGCTGETMGFKSTDMITGGFPCQDVSRIGKHKGLNSMRSGLCFQLFRLSDELAPTFLFLENVPALVKHLKTILDELHLRGFDARWTTVAASNFGAPHKRERIFILACRREGGGGGSLTASAATLARKDKRYASSACCFSVARGWGLAWKNARAARWPAGPVPRWARGRSAQAKVLAAWRKPTNRLRLTRKGTPKWKARCEALGNAVVPACVRAAFMHLVLGDSGRVVLPSSTAGSPKDQTNAVKFWMDRSETAMAEAIATEGLETAWRSCARLAAGGASKPKSPKMPLAGVMLDGVIGELRPLALALPTFLAGSPSLPPGGITLVSNGKRSNSAKQTRPLVQKPIRLRRLATPRHKGWGVSSVLTERSRYDLITQLAFASDRRDNASHVNPGYVEYMMGFPLGWTQH